MNTPIALEAKLQQLISHASLNLTPLPQTSFQLWLINPDNMQGQFSSEQTQKVLEEPPYWCFCWASGLALAQWILANPQQVAGKSVIDVGCGSGVVALAAKRAGAQRVVACDLDPVALAATQANAKANQLELEYSTDLFSQTERYDCLFAADLLYDPDNLPLLNQFPRFARQITIADSRQRNFSHPLYQTSQRLVAETLPDLAEPEEFRQVTLYQSVAR